MSGITNFFSGLFGGCGAKINPELSIKEETKPVDPYAELRPIWERKYTEEEIFTFKNIIQEKIPVLNGRRIAIQRERELSEELLKEQTLCINGILSSPLSEVGSGGSKSALDLGNNRVLLLPRKGPISMWHRIVHEEVAFSQFLQKEALLTPVLERVSVSAPGSSGQIEAYTAPSFKGLAESGLFIVDAKNAFSSTWVQGKDFLFASDEERFEPSNWEPILKSTVEDLKKVCAWEIPSGGDSLNMAVVKQADGFVLRYFGFDFTSESREAHVPTTAMPPSTVTKKAMKKLLVNFLDVFFHYEFHERYYWGTDEERQKISVLMNALIEKSLEKINE